MSRKSAVAAGLVASLLAAPARADDFQPGSLILPMDTTYQDDGMF